MYVKKVSSFKWNSASIKKLSLTFSTDCWAEKNNGPRIFTILGHYLKKK